MREEIPGGDRAVANLVLIDVFHHVAHPARFFDEAARVLHPGGRVVILRVLGIRSRDRAYR
jgi:ubiquinone/menaquinone biosynthesis C-methylase UbiE